MNKTENDTFRRGIWVLLAIIFLFLIIGLIFGGHMGRRKAYIEVCQKLGYDKVQMVGHVFQLQAPYCVKVESDTTYLHPALGILSP